MALDHTSRTEAPRPDVHRLPVGRLVLILLRRPQRIPALLAMLACALLVRHRRVAGVGYRCVETPAGSELVRELRPHVMALNRVQARKPR